MVNHWLLTISLCFIATSLLPSNSMSHVLQHGSSSGYIHDGPYFLIAEQHLQVVADMLADTTFQAMGADQQPDATASLSTIRAILSPGSHGVHAKLTKEAKIDDEKKMSTKELIGAMDGVGIDQTGHHDDVTAGYDSMEAIGADALTCTTGPHLILAKP